jgi:pyridoxal phosphate enzyme (YggS family)
VPLDADVQHNLAEVRRRIAAAAHRANRSPASITLVAVSKTFPLEFVRAAAACGQLIFGENRVQEAAAKAEALGDLPLEWHLIGHLQSNKARKAVAAVQWIQSIDSLELLKRTEEAAGDLGVRRSVLLQVDLAHEATKHGADARALPALAAAAVDARWLTLEGLMTIPPFPDQPEDSRPWFRRLREVRDNLIDAGIPAAHLGHLSMGMSDDFEVAIEEGATIVRVGTAIFGRRPVPVAKP